MVLLPLLSYFRAHVAGKNALLTRDYAILRGPPARYGNILVYTFIPLLKLPISTALFGSDSVRALGTDIPGTRAGPAGNHSGLRACARGGR